MESTDTLQPSYLSFCLTCQHLDALLPWNVLGPLSGNQAGRSSTPSCPLYRDPQSHPKPWSRTMAEACPSTASTHKGLHRSSCWTQSPLLWPGKQVGDLYSCSCPQISNFAVSSPALIDHMYGLGYSLWFYFLKTPSNIMEDSDFLLLVDSFSIHLFKITFSFV